VITVAAAARARTGAHWHSTLDSEYETRVQCQGYQHTQVQSFAGNMRELAMMRFSSFGMLDRGRLRKDAAARMAIHTCNARSHKIRATLRVIAWQQLLPARSP